MKKDISDIEDIKLMVNAFYDQIREDEVLGPIFNGIIQDRWSQHLEKMYTFWQTILLEEHTYFGSPFPPHAKLPVDASHFEQWLQLFNQNIDNLFEGTKADEAKWRAAKMAQMFQIKIDYIQQKGFKSIV
ncbi:MAG: group III truncated hemoglobin [Saprospiraceae bacterium]|nr:group III truncated hemoglobin [Saprospiraceae bacterium]